MSKNSQPENRKQDPAPVRPVKIDAKTTDLLQVGRVLDFFAGRAFSSLGAESVRSRRALAMDADDFEELFLPIREAWKLYAERDEPPLQGLFDASPLIDSLRPVSTYLPGKDFLRLAKFIELAGPAKGFARHRAASTPWLADKFGAIEPAPEASSAIRRIVDDEGAVRDHATPRLSSLRSELRKWDGRIQRTIQRILKHAGGAGHLSDTFYTIRDGRYCLPVQANKKGSVAGISHGSSSSGETIFVEPLELVVMSNEHANLVAAEEEEVRRILIDLGDVVRPCLDALKWNLELYRELDDIAARARTGWDLGLKIPALKNQPVVRWDEGAQDRAETGFEVARPNARGALDMIEAHHPLLFLGLTETKESIPIDLPLRAGDRVLVLSGPNAGGKTTTLKMVGLLIWLAQAGFPLPIGADASLPIVDHIGAVIGDQQDILAGDSTFSAHLKRLRDVVEATTSGSLLLLDEIAAGTDPTEGGPLAISLLERLGDLGALVVCTSHLGPVKEWANAHRAARNASFRLDPSNHSPTFRLTLDVPGISEALVVAERIGMDRRVIERARELIPEERARAQKLLATLHEKSLEADRRAARQAETAEAQAKMERELADRKESLRAEKQAFRERMLLEKLRDLKQIRAEIEKQVAALPPREGLKESRGQVNAALESAEGELRRSLRRETGSPGNSPGDGSSFDDGPVDIETLEAGRTIFVRPLGAEAEVVRVERDRGLVRLLVNGVEIEMGAGQINTRELPRIEETSELKPFNLDKALGKEDATSAGTAGDSNSSSTDQPTRAAGKSGKSRQEKKPRPKIVPAPQIADAAAAHYRSPKGNSKGSSMPGTQSGSKPTGGLADVLADVIKKPDGDQKRGLFRNRQSVAQDASPTTTEKKSKRGAATQDSFPADSNGPKSAKPKPSKKKEPKKKKFSEADFYASTLHPPKKIQKTNAKATRSETLSYSSASQTRTNKKGDVIHTGEKGGYTLKRAAGAHAPGLTVDLHGMTVEEAIVAVDSHIDDALLNNYPFIRIMHGFGTGALRRGIHGHLKGHPSIKRLGIASPAEGGGGVTEVEFH